MQNAKKKKMFYCDTSCNLKVSHKLIFFPWIVKQVLSAFEKIRFNYYVQSITKDSINYIEFLSSEMKDSVDFVQLPYSLHSENNFKLANHS